MKYFISFTLLLIAFSCKTESNTYDLEGTSIGLEDGTKIFVYQVLDDNQPKIIDTLVVNKGSFSSTYPKSDILAMNYLNVENSKANIIFFPENVDLKVTIDKDDILNAEVKGGKQNELYSSYIKKINEFNEQKKKNIAAYRKAREKKDDEAASEIQKNNIRITNEASHFKKDFVTKNNNSLFSTLLLIDMLNSKEINAAETQEILDNLSPKIAASSYVTKIKESLSKIKKADVGAMAPDFSAPNPEGEVISLKDAMGKYTIIDFWASWCKPCRRENPNVVRVYNKYHDKGLNIISISLDKESQKQRWIQAIKDDKLSWTNISNLKFWREPIALQYNVRSIPATFLIDSEGKIIAKNLRGLALENKMKELFGQ